MNRECDVTESPVSRTLFHMEYCTITEGLENVRKTQEAWKAPKRNLKTFELVILKKKLIRRDVRPEPV